MATPYSLSCINSTLASAVEKVGKTSAEYLNVPGEDFISMFQNIAYGADDSTFKVQFAAYTSKLLDYQKVWRIIKEAVVLLRNNNLIGTAVPLKVIYDNTGNSVLLSNSDIDKLDAINQYYTLYLNRQSSSSSTADLSKTTHPPQEKATEQPEQEDTQSQAQQQQKEAQQQERKNNVKEQGKTTPGITDQYHLHNRTSGELINNFDKDYVLILCKCFNQATRNSTKTPQIPVSVLVSISLARTGLDPNKLQHYDFWYLAYDKDISEMRNDSNGRCGFESFEGGIRGVMTLLQRDKSAYASDLSELKPKMSESSEKAKKSTIKKILTRLNSTTSGSIEEQYKLAIAYIDQYKLFEWDTDKTKENDGHSDDIPTSEDNKVLNKITQELGKVFKTLTDKLSGTEFKIEAIPQGGDFVLLIKLPKGKCYCEPIYPDLVTVGDQVPSWVYSQEYVEAYAAAEKAVLDAYGLSTATSAEEAALEAANKAIEDFKEQQFKAWCIDYGIDYETDEQKAEAVKQYQAAAAKNEYGYFSTDGIYMPDESSKSTYQALLAKRNLALKTSTDAATKYTQAQYNTALKATAETIKQREGSWNQDTGTYISTATSGTTDIIGSQVTPAGSTATVKAGDNSGTNIDSRVENAVKWAEKIAADDTKGYVYGAAGPDNYDCSGFVWKAFQEGGGFDIPDRSDVSFEKAGFKKTEFPGPDKLIRGDILLRDEQHEGIYTGNGQHAASHSASFPKDEQIDISPVGNNWSHIMRFPTPSGSVITHDLSSLTIIGDSIFLAPRITYLKQLMTISDDRVRIKGSQDVTWGYEQALDLQKQNKLGSVVVIEMGTNGGLVDEPYASKAKQLLELLGSSRTIYWVTTYCSYNQNVVERTNAWIRSLPASHSNVKVIDWYSLVVEKGYCSGDGCHPKDDVESKAFAQLIKNTINP